MEKSFKRPEPVDLKKPKNALKESVFSIIKNYKREGNSTSYESVMNYLMVKPPPPKLCSHWLSQLRDAVPLLDKSTENIIISTLKIPWQYGEETIELHIQNFIISVVTAHNYFVAPILECLFKQLIPVITPKNFESLRLEPYQLEEEEQVKYYKTLNLVKTIAMHVPLCQNIILKTARSITPYYKNHSHIHVIFKYNMLLLAQLMPHLRRPLFEIIFSNILKMDLHSPRSELEDDIFEDSDHENEDVFKMDVESEKVPAQFITSHAVGHNLDMVMILMQRFIHFTSHGGINFQSILQKTSLESYEVNGCRAGSSLRELNSYGVNGCGCGGKGHDLPSLKQLYIDLKYTFAKIVVPTHSTFHLQFIMFYLLSVRPSLVSDFLDSLKSVFERPENAMEERKNAVSYLGSLLARGAFVKFSHVHYCLEILYNYCKFYLKNEVTVSNSYEEPRLHRPFYYACQTLFYVFTFNYKEYTESKSRIRLAQSLHFDELVLSTLNPLRFCSKAIAMNFAAVTCHYQLAYCYTVLNNNSRVFLPMAMHNSYGVFEAQVDSLDMSFPFDPYLLKRSAPLIMEHYKQFGGLPEHILKHAANLKGSTERRNSMGEYDSEMEDENSPCVSPKSLPRLE